MAVAIASILTAIPIVIVGAAFVWAAKRDGEDEREFQRWFRRRNGSS